MTTGNVKIVYLSGNELLDLFRDFDVKPGDLTIAGRRQVDELAKAAVSRRLQKMAEQMTAEDRLKFFLSSKKEPSHV